MSDHLRDLPPRLTTTEVCILGRFSKRTLRKRRLSGAFTPEPVDRGAEDLYRRDEVLVALGLIQNDQSPTEQEKPRFDADAVRAARSRQVRRRPGPSGGRDVPGAVRGSGAPPALRLAFDATASD